MFALSIDNLFWMKTHRNAAMCALLVAVILVHNTAHNAVFMRWNAAKMYDERTLPDVLMGPLAVNSNLGLLRTIAFGNLCAGAIVLAYKAPGSESKFILHRFILVYSVASVLRCVTFFVTLLPATASYCVSPRHGGTYSPLRAPHTVRDVFFRFDWTHSCGDLLFSGHTILVSCCYFLIFTRCNPKNKVFAFSRFMSHVAFVTFLVLTVYTRKHYTIDVLIALCVTLMLWHIIRPTERIEEAPTDSSPEA
jgi:hypothetical protein